MYGVHVESEPINLLRCWQSSIKSDGDLHYTSSGMSTTYLRLLDHSPSLRSSTPPLRLSLSALLARPSSTAGLRLSRHLRVPIRTTAFRTSSEKLRKSPLAGTTFHSL